MPSPATNQAARISAKNIKHPKAKLSVTTINSPTSSRGNFRVMGKSLRRNYIASRFTSKPFISPSGVINDLQTQSLETRERESGRQARRVQRARHSRASFVARNARHCKRAAPFRSEEHT